LTITRSPKGRSFMESPEMKQGLKNKSTNMVLLKSEERCC